MNNCFVFFEVDLSELREELFDLIMDLFGHVFIIPIF